LSVQVLAAVWNADIEPAGLKLVALALADAAEPDGSRAFPGRDRLGRMTRLKPSMIRYYIGDLIEAGVVIEVRRAFGSPRGGPTQRREFRFDLAKLAASVVRPLPRDHTGATRPAPVEGTGATPSAPVEGTGATPSAPVEGTGATRAANRRHPVGEQAPPGPPPSVLTRPDPSFGASTKPNPNGHRRDELFEAVADACGIDWANDLTKSARGSLVKAVKDLRAVGADPQEVRHRAGRWKYAATLTPSALAKHWPQLVGTSSRRVSQPAFVDSPEWKDQNRPGWRDG
jgi:hypothetical protein